MFSKQGQGKNKQMFVVNMSDKCSSFLSYFSDFWLFHDSRFPYELLIIIQFQTKGKGKYRSMNITRIIIKRQIRKYRNERGKLGRYIRK